MLDEHLRSLLSRRVQQEQCALSPQLGQQQQTREQQREQQQQQQQQSGQRVRVSAACVRHVLVRDARELVRSHRAGDVLEHNAPVHAGVQGSPTQVHPLSDRLPRQRALHRRRLDHPLQQQHHLPGSLSASQRPNQPRQVTINKELTP